MFKIYINKHLIIDFIKHFQSFVDAFVLFVSKFNENFRFCIDYKNLNELTIKNRYLLFFIKKKFESFCRRQTIYEIKFHDCLSSLQNKKK